MIDGSLIQPVFSGRENGRCEGSQFWEIRLLRTCWTLDRVNTTYTDHTGKVRLNVVLNIIGHLTDEFGM
jgi:hypothetical protein